MRVILPVNLVTPKATSRKPVEKPYSLHEYAVIDRNAKPPTVTPAIEMGRNATEGAARRAAKENARCCLMNGVKNIIEVRGPDGFIERWIKKSEWSIGSRGGRGRVVPREFTGEFVVVEPAGSAAPEGTPC